MMDEITLLAIKPDSVSRGLIGKIIQRVEDKGLDILDIAMFTPDHVFAKAFYAEHIDKEFFERLIDSFCAGPVVFIKIGGIDAVTIVRNMVGPASEGLYKAGTIRGDYATYGQFNVVHASASKEDACEELRLVRIEVGG
jgi:nucleoside-diphosphate kinase